jgi:uncharacterized protein
MQLTRDGSAVHFIRAWEPGRLRVADRWLTGNVIVGSEQILEGWTSVAPHQLTIAELEPALALEPTIIVLGTGTERLLPDVELMAAVAARSVGLEIMNTPAACRTFNVLLQEQRRVVAALFNP